MLLPSAIMWNWALLDSMHLQWVPFTGLAWIVRQLEMAWRDAALSTLYGWVSEEWCGGSSSLQILHWWRKARGPLNQGENSIPLPNLPTACKHVTGLIPQGGSAGVSVRLEVRTPVPVCGSTKRRQSGHSLTPPQGVRKVMLGRHQNLSWGWVFRQKSKAESWISAQRSTCTWVVLSLLDWLLAWSFI